MEWMGWIRKTLRTERSRESKIDSYWESEGLCKMETTPQILVPGLTVGPAIVSTGKKYCVRR